MNLILEVDISNFLCFFEKYFVENNNLTLGMFL